MPRKARFAPPGYWRHLTQRGNNQQRIFASDADRQYCLQLLETHSEQRAVTSTWLRWAISPMPSRSS